MIYFNGDIKQIHFNGFAISKIYACNGELVWSSEPPTPTSAKYSYHTSGGTNYSAACDSSSVLTSGETSANVPVGDKIVSAVVGDCVTEIGDKAFDGMTALSAITLPTTITRVGNSAFTVTNIISIDLPNVQSIGDFAFHTATALTGITLPNTLTTIGRQAFMACDDLSAVTIPSGVTTIPYECFDLCAALTSVTISEGVQIIDEEAFTNCTALQRIDIPNSVTSIGVKAFMGDNVLTEINIGSGVTSIGDWAFGGTAGSRTVTCLATTPPTLGSFALPSYNVSVLYVPDASISAYQSASGWSSISNIRGISEKP